MVSGGRKAQLTVFIILGLLVVVGVALYLTIRAAPQPTPSVLTAPVEVRPVVQFVTDCLTRSARDGIVRIGAGGGYIDVKSFGATVNTIDPTEGDAVSFTADSQLAMPYWWYLKAPNTCTGACEFATFRPPLLREGGRNSIESQLDAYVAAETERCTGNFTTFLQQGFAIGPQARPAVTTAVAENGVSFVLDWPLLIVRNGQQFRQDRFADNEQVPLYEMYNVATEMTQSETKNNFLERHILQVINSFTGLQAGQLPPVAAATFELDFGKRWVKEDVRRRVQELITAYVPLLRVWGAANGVYLEAPASTRDPALWERLYDLNMIVPLEQNHPRFEVRFSAPQWWRQYFDLNCRGQVCAPDSFVNTFGFPFGFQKYNFAYDVSAPVLVEIRDPQSFGGKGFVFQYAMEANVRNNEPMPLQGFYPTGANATPGATLFCDPEQRTSGMITVNVHDSLDKPVDTSLMFRCGDESCPVGSSVNGVFTGRFPRCAGGFLTAMENDRYAADVPLNTHTEDNQQVEVVSDPIVTLKADFERIRLVKTNGIWTIDPTPQPRRGGDQAVIVLEREGNAYDQPFASSVEMCGRGSQQALSEARLVPGTYDVTVLGMYYDQVIFPPQKRCTGEYCFTIPEEPLVFGQAGAVCDGGNPLLEGTASFKWTITPQELYGSSKIMFKSLVAAIDELPEQSRQIEDLDAAGDTGDRSSAYAAWLAPEVLP
jgi:hypothetical protein